VNRCIDSPALGALNVPDTKQASYLPQVPSLTVNEAECTLLFRKRHMAVMANGFKIFLVILATNVTTIPVDWVDVIDFEVVLPRLLTVRLALLPGIAFTTYNTLVVIALDDRFPCIRPNVIADDASLTRIAAPTTATTWYRVAATITMPFYVNGATINLHKRDGYDRRRRTISSTPRTGCSPSWSCTAYNAPVPQSASHRHASVTLI